ncbi:MAG: hypothetical protein ACYCPT_13580, partial [Acidimicrobiales bacterium]
IGNEVNSTTIKEPPSVKQAANRLEKMLDAIWRMGDRDECSIKHVNHALAAVVCGHSWCDEDLGDYNLPIDSKIGYVEWPWPGAGTVEEELGHRPWNNDQEWRDRVERWLSNPNYVADGRKKITQWQTKLATQWGIVEALRSLIGREAFFDAALLAKHSTYLPYYLDEFWIDELLPNEKLEIAKTFEERGQRFRASSLRQKAPLTLVPNSSDGAIETQ